MRVEVGDYVEVTCNAEGTMWRHGVVAQITERGAIIGYGHPHYGREWLCYGMYQPVPLRKLRVIQKAPKKKALNLGPAGRAPKSGGN